MSRRPALFALLTAVALLVVGCSAGGGEHATPTTAKVTPTTNARHPIGKCPTDPVAVESSMSSNTGVHGLATKLVPINAFTARVCNYTQDVSQVASSVLTGTAASQLEVDTNRLRSPPAPDLGPGGGGIAFFIVFASATKQVEVAYVESSDYTATNGVFSAFPSQTWVAELQRNTTGPTATVTGTNGLVEGLIRLLAGVAINHQVSGTITATKTSGQRWRATTASTGPFSLMLPAGTYRLTGTSPTALRNGASQQCSAPAPVIVRGMDTTQAEVVCDLG